MLALRNCQRYAYARYISRLVSDIAEQMIGSATILRSVERDRESERYLDSIRAIQKGRDGQYLLAGSIL